MAIWTSTMSQMMSLGSAKLERLMAKPTKPPRETNDGVDVGGDAEEARGAIA
jgi:hypothetical protein